MHEHTYTHIRTQPHTHTRMHTKTHACIQDTHRHAYSNRDTRTITRMHAHIKANTHTSTYRCTQTYIRERARRTHTHTHTYTSTHTHATIYTKKDINAYHKRPQTTDAPHIAIRLYLYSMKCLMIYSLKFEKVYQVNQFERSLVKLKVHISKYYI